MAVARRRAQIGAVAVVPVNRVPGVGQSDGFGLFGMGAVGSDGKIPVIVDRNDFSHKIPLFCFFFQLLVSDCYFTRAMGQSPCLIKI